MLVIMALIAAGLFGVADFMGGRASRVAPALVVTFLGQGAALVVLFAIAMISGVPLAPLNDWVWGGLAGIAGGAGLLAFYRAMGSGFMTVAAPISAVMTGAVPVVVGLVQGERPGALAIAGMPIALLSVVLVSDLFGPGHRRAPRIVVVLAFISGLVFGSLFVLLDHTSSTSGVWPVVAMRAASVPFLALVVLGTRARVSTGRAAIWLIAFGGVFDSLANAFFLFATREGLMSVVAVIIALYPATTLALAIRLDREKVHRSQVVGLVIAVPGLVLLALG